MVYTPSIGQDFVGTEDMRVWVQRELERIASSIAETEETVVSGGGVGEAPDDGKQYGRQNEVWTEIVPVPGPPGEPGPPGGIDPDSIPISAFDPGLRDYIQNHLNSMMIDDDWIRQLIANEATEQDAHNWLEKLDDKRTAVSLREQVSAQFGLVWRGEWDEFTLYHPGDQVRYLDKYYWTDTETIASTPLALPWRQLFSLARISEEWKTFAGDDGVVAQSSDSIETRFGTKTLPISTATMIEKWAAFAGPLYAAAQTSEVIEARFKGGTANDMETNVAKIMSEWKVFAGNDYSQTTTADSIEARFGGTLGNPELPLSLATLTERWKAWAGDNLAVSQSEDTLTATVNGHTTSITQTASAVTTMDGKLGATWQLKLNANEYVTGVKFYNDGTERSNVTFLTDNFLIAKPGISGPIGVFGVGPRNGVNTLVMNGNLVADGSVIANSIAANQVTATHVGANEIVTQSANIRNLVVDNIHVRDRSMTNWALAADGSNTGPIGGEINIIVTNVGYRGVNGSSILVSVQGFLTYVNAGDAPSQGRWTVYANNVNIGGGDITLSGINIINVPVYAAATFGANGGDENIQVRLTIQRTGFGGGTQAPACFLRSIQAIVYMR